MKRIFLLILLAACSGNTTTGDDAGNTDSGADATASDSSTKDSSSSDSPSDSSTSDVTQGGDGGSLDAGATCDPNDNQCGAGLLCCSEPNHVDGGSSYSCEKPVNNGCPLFP